jgi:hypothetical protein
LGRGDGRDATIIGVGEGKERACNQFGTKKLEKDMKCM